MNGLFIIRRAINTHGGSITPDSAIREALGEAMSDFSRELIVGDKIPCDIQEKKARMLLEIDKTVGMGPVEPALYSSFRTTGLRYEVQLTVRAPLPETPLTNGERSPDLTRLLDETKKALAEWEDIIERFRQFQGCSTSFRTEQLRRAFEAFE